MSQCQPVTRWIITLMANTKNQPKKDPKLAVYWFPYFLQERQEKRALVNSFLCVYVPCFPCTLRCVNNDTRQGRKRPDMVEQRINFHRFWSRSNFLPYRYCKLNIIVSQWCEKRKNYPPPPSSPIKHWKKDGTERFRRWSVSSFRYCTTSVVPSTCHNVRAGTCGDSSFHYQASGPRRMAADDESERHGKGWYVLAPLSDGRREEKKWLASFS